MNQITFQKGELMTFPFPSKIQETGPDVSPGVDLRQVGSIEARLQFTSTLQDHCTYGGVHVVTFMES